MAFTSQPLTDNLTTRPDHHIHSSNDPLPGSRGGVPTVDYSAATIERTPSSALDTSVNPQPSDTTTRDPSSAFKSSGLRNEALTEGSEHVAGETGRTRVESTDTRRDDSSNARDESKREDVKSAHDGAGPDPVVKTYEKQDGSVDGYTSKETGSTAAPSTAKGVHSGFDATAGKHDDPAAAHIASTARTSEGADKHTATDKALPSKPHDELPEGHASAMDKIAGKTQKIVGKALNNTDMKDKGELRATAGKEAVKGYAATAPGA